jgi:hypothetical protein
VQRVGASYVGKKLYDYLTTSPTPAAAVEPDEGVEEVEAAESIAPVDELDGQPFFDENGQPLGTARRLAGVAVYVVTDGYASRHGELLRSLEEPESRIIWHTVDGRITALIYVPDPTNAPSRPEGMRADDV